jgi:hypothetical protein
VSESRHIVQPTATLSRTWADLPATVLSDERIRTRVSRSLERVGDSRAGGWIIDRLCGFADGVTDVRHASCCGGGPTAPAGCLPGNRVIGVSGPSRIGALCWARRPSTAARVAAWTTVARPRWPGPRRENPLRGASALAYADGRRTATRGRDIPLTTPTQPVRAPGPRRLGARTRAPKHRPPTGRAVAHHQQPSSPRRAVIGRARPGRGPTGQR